MKKTIQLFAGMISISSSMLLTACGQPQVSIARPMEVKASQTNPYNGSPTSSAATTTHALKQVLRYSIEGVGSGGQQIKVYTKNTLKMRFIPGVQTQTDSQTGRVSHYTALSVSLRVGSRKITTSGTNCVVSTSGTVNHIAFYNSGTIIAVGTCTATAVTAAGTMTVNAFDLDEIGIIS